MKFKYISKSMWLISTCELQGDFILKEDARYSQTLCSS